MVSEYEVFLSFKNLDAEGRQSRDGILAEEVFRFLSNKEVKVFYSNLSREALGISAYKQAINDALDQARVLVVVGTSGENLSSPWVRYEWASFFSAILNGVKREARVFVYLEGVVTNDLPRALRQSQVIQHGQDSAERLYRFISAALGRKRPSSIREGIAIALHEQFRSSASAQPDSYSQVKPWEDLPDRFKEASLAQADHIIASLKTIGYEITQGRHTPRVWRQTEEDIETLSQLEHERWNQERMDAGWSFGPTQDEARKTTPYLLPWESLPDHVKECGRVAARSIPNILASLGLEVVPSSHPQ